MIIIYIVVNLFHYVVTQRSYGTFVYTRTWRFIFFFILILKCCYCRKVQWTGYWFLFYAFFEVVFVIIGIRIQTYDLLLVHFRVL